MASRCMDTCVHTCTYIHTHNEPICFHYEKQIFPLLLSGKFPKTSLFYGWLWLIYQILFWYSADWSWLMCLSAKHTKRKLV